MPLVVTHQEVADATFSARGETAWEANHVVGGSVNPDQGGTGISTYEIGDLLTASTTSGLARIAAVPTNQLLVSQGTSTQPQWSSAPSVSTFTVALGNLTVDTGQVLTAAGTNAAPGYSFGNAPTIGLFLRSDVAIDAAFGGGNSALTIQTGSMNFRSTYVLAWSATADAAGAVDVQLSRLAGNSFGSDSHFSPTAAQTNARDLGITSTNLWRTGYFGTSVMVGDASTDALIMDSSGRFYGAALHNNASAVTGSTNQYVASGTYSPTLSSIANLDGQTTFQAQWMRVGNVVTVTGKVQVDPALTATLTRLGFTLPIASSLSDEEDCAGAAFASGISGQGAAIRAEPTNDQAEMVWIASDITVQPMYYSYSYEIR